MLFTQNQIKTKTNKYASMFVREIKKKVKLLTKFENRLSKYDKSLAKFKHNIRFSVKVVNANSTKVHVFYKFFL